VPLSWAERVTASADGVLFAISLGSAVLIQRRATSARRKRKIWSLAFYACALVAGLGAISHGVVAGGAAHEMLRRVFHLFLGLTVALIIAGVVGDQWSEAIAVRVAPFVAGVAILFTPVLHRLPAESLLLVGLESVVLIASLLVYLRLAMRREVGAWSMVIGFLLGAVGVTLARLDVAPAAGIIDRNALAHLAHAAAVFALAFGVRSSLDSHGT
jgi:hypothetical protein